MLNVIHVNNKVPSTDEAYHSSQDMSISHNFKFI